MSINYAYVYAYEAKFSGELFKSQAGALESDLNAAADMVAAAASSEIIDMALSKESPLRAAMRFLLDCGWDVKYYREQARDAVATVDASAVATINAAAVSSKAVLAEDE